MPSAEGDRPVNVKNDKDEGLPSNPGHEKPWVNTAGPSAKAKYYLKTDSEPVPWGKGEKNPEQGSEIEPETIRLQAAGALKWCDRVPFA